MSGENIIWAPFGSTAAITTTGVEPLNIDQLFGDGGYPRANSPFVAARVYIDKIVWMASAGVVTMAGFVA